LGGTLWAVASRGKSCFAERIDFAEWIEFQHASVVIAFANQVESLPI